MTTRSRFLLGIAALALAAGCATTSSPTTTPAPGVSELRIRNEGPAAAQSLVVQFPDAEVAFGDLAPGATSAYRAVSGGVYNYAAYTARIGGREVAVPVIDWVGETPKAAGSYTFVIAVDANADLPVMLRNVERDR